MANLKLDNGDLELDGGSQLKLASDEDAVDQDVASSLAVTRGEQFTDLDAGFPWRDFIGRKPIPLERLRTAIKEFVEARRGVLRITSVELDIDDATRILTITMSGHAASGTVDFSIAAPIAL